MSNSNDLNQTFLDARNALSNARLVLPRGSEELDAVKALKDKLDAEQITNSQKRFAEGSANLEALATELSQLITRLEANPVSSALESANKALGKINTLAQKLSDLAS